MWAGGGSKVSPLPVSDLSRVPGLFLLFRYARFVWFGGWWVGGGAFLLYRTYTYIGGIVVHNGQSLAAVRCVRFVRCVWFVCLLGKRGGESDIVDILGHRGLIALSGTYRALSNRYLSCPLCPISNLTGARRVCAYLGRGHTRQDPGPGRCAPA